MPPTTPPPASTRARRDGARRRAMRRSIRVSTASPAEASHSSSVPYTLIPCVLSFRHMTLAGIVDTPRAVIGMVHLRALPGSPRWGGRMDEVVRAALDDARALAEGGVDAILVENHGDVPF